MLPSPVVIVLKGRQGGDHDLARLLRRTKWGGGAGSAAEGCSVEDLIDVMEDPLGRGRFREVSDLFAGLFGPRYYHGE